MKWIECKLNIDYKNSQVKPGDFYNLIIFIILVVLIILAVFIIFLFVFFHNLRHLLIKININISKLKKIIQIKKKNEKI